ncbi:MAG: PspC domain-containing protein, partial [Gordonia sp. (in: high G+C Gram-positive bacteria)]|uniref:PspC domain-containing protein n=1 Tax=Gordonia sp. (in: high G+C Gram-positive bacteria) TaxID=84139 RepID=UPI003BB64406
MNTTTLQDFWATRPVRRRREGKVAGVCAGLGARYDVDPTLIRIAFVVATLFGGSGILLYIVASLVMPSARDGSKADASLSTGKLIVLGVIAVILVTSFGRDAMWSSGGLLGAVLMAVGCWLLYQRTPVPPPGTAVSQP